MDSRASSLKIRAEWPNPGDTTDRDRLVDQWIGTRQTHHSRNVKHADYLSPEFLIGRWLVNHVINLRLEEGLSPRLPGPCGARALCDTDPAWSPYRRSRRSTQPPSRRIQIVSA